MKLNGDFMKREVLIKLLSLKNEWNQRDLVASAGCTKGYVSRTIKKLEDLNIVTKISRGKIVVIDLPKLLNYWVSIRKMPRCMYVDIDAPVEAIERKLKGSKIGGSKLNYSITLFRGAWHRIKLLKIEKIEIYVQEKDLQKLLKMLGRLGGKSRPYGKVEIYVADKYDLAGSEKVGGLNLASVTQNYVDLMVAGGNGTRVALELAKRFGLLGV